MVLVAYISGHGFGHATRVVTVLNRIAATAPDWHVIVRTSAPRWFLEQSLNTPVTIETVEADPGAAQVTSLSVDVCATAHRAASFYRTFDARVTEEAARLRAAGASVVVGDIPPLAFAAAAVAGVKSVALANFTWDWIYEGYPAFEEMAPGALPMIRRAYTDATEALRLPFHGGFETIRHVIDVPLVARRSSVGRREARRMLGFRGAEPLVLASFGGHGAHLALEAVAERNDFILLATDHEGAPSRSNPGGRLRVLSSAELRSLHMRYEDLVAAADVVVSKPGYGIVSECIANETALLYTSRGSFVEQEVLVAGMQRVLRCAFIDREDLTAGRWQQSVDGLREQPAPRETMFANGASVVADRILRIGG